MKERWLTCNEVAAHFGVTRVTVWRWVKAGKIPPPIKIGTRTIRFDLKKIEAVGVEV